METIKALVQRKITHLTDQLNSATYHQDEASAGLKNASELKFSLEKEIFALQSDLKQIDLLSANNHGQSISGANADCVKSYYPKELTNEQREYIESMRRWVKIEDNINEQTLSDIENSKKMVDIHNRSIIIQSEKLQFDVDRKKKAICDFREWCELNNLSDYTEYIQF